MKKNILILALFLIAQFSAFSESIKIEPIKFDYQDIVNFDDDMYLLANKGFIHKYNINSEQMEKIQVFNSGTVIKLYRLDNAFYAFNDLGEMAISYNNGQTWQVKQIDDKYLLSAIQASDYFYVRDSVRIFKIDKEGNIQKGYSIDSPTLRKYNEEFTPNYLYSMSIFKNQIAVETDSNKILLFDADLNLIDSIEIIKSEVYIKDTLKYMTGYRLATDGEFLYLTMYSPGAYTSIYQIDELKNVILKETKVNVFGRIKGTENIINSIDFSEKKYIDSNRLSFTYLFPSGGPGGSSYNASLNDYNIRGGYLYIVGKYGIFEKYNLMDSTLEVISEQYWMDENRCPLPLNDSTMVFYSGLNYNYTSYMNQIFYIAKNMSTYQSTIFKNNPKYSDTLKTTRFAFIEYNESTGIFSLIGKKHYIDYTTEGIFESQDTLKTFDFTPTSCKGYELLPVIYTNYDLEGYNYGIMTISLKSPKIKSYKITKYYIRTPSQNPYTKKMITGFTITNNQYYPIGEFIDSGYVLDYVYFRGFNSILIHCANTSDSGQSEVRYTTNQGASWEYVHKYPKQDTLLQKYDIEFQGKYYLILFHFDGYYTKTKMYMDIVDAQKNEWRRLREWDLTKESKYFNSRFGLSSDDATIYFAIGDTLFTITDIYDQSKWQYKILPDSGMLGDPIVRYGNKFIAKYWNKYNNIFGYGLSLIGFDDTLGVVDYWVEKRNYFYAYPPYPLPAGEMVQAKIFWDLVLDINTAEIKVYDIYGKEISDGKDIAIMPESGWSGTLIWNCKGVTPGVYLITIKYGTERKVIKVVKG